jgi:hypothetical protein
MNDLKIITGGKPPSPNPAPVKIDPSPSNMSVLTLWDHRRYLEQMRDLLLNFADTLGAAIAVIQKDGPPKKRKKPRAVRST